MIHLITNPSLLYPSAAPAGILLGFKAGLADPNGSMADWQAGANPCSRVSPWNGISCDGDGWVVGLWMDRKRLRGRLDGTLAWLERLQEIHLAGNELFGEFCAVMGQWQDARDQRQ